MLGRKQILVPAALDKRIRRLAQKTGISQSALIVAAVEASLDASGQTDHLKPFIGVIKGAPPTLSESVENTYR
jgi:Ribbon-helix-helix protein, copG family